MIISSIAEIGTIAKSYYERNYCRSDVYVSIHIAGAVLDKGQNCRKFAGELSYCVNKVTSIFRIRHILRGGFFCWH